MNLVIRFEDDGDDFLLEKPRIDPEVVAAAADQLLVYDVGLVDILMIVVVLDQRERPVDSPARNRCGSDPVVDQPCGTSTGSRHHNCARISHVDPQLRHDAAAFSASVNARALIE